jgi:pimeloyl-ACP methyl ester carboxylesterase
MGAVRRSTAIVALISAVALGAPTAGAERACTTHTVPMSLPDGPSERNVNIVTELCLPAPPGGRVIHVLASGATYGPLAWDFPYQPERYSYVRALNEAGIATLNVDRLGIGRSSHPNSGAVTTSAHIAIYHQLIQRLRDGAFGATFDKVVIVGHSYGAVITYGLANRYPADVDGVIITGLQHEFDKAFLQGFWANLHPANEEGGRFAGLDRGYLTSRPGQRGAYYRQETVDPKVVQLDEETKETFTTADARTFPPVMGESQGITAPVLDVVGQYDAWFCANEPCSTQRGTPSREHRWFPATPCFEQFVLPDAGHDINLHLNASTWFRVAVEWSRRMVAGSGPCPAQS